MKYFKTYILLILAMCFVSCGEEENPQTIPYAPCYFTIDLTGTHSEINGSYTIGAFVKDKSGFEKQLTNASVVKVYGFRNLAAERYGYAGVLVLNKGSELLAFDLCCPNEDNQNIRVLPNDSYRAKCQKCKSEFDLVSGGFPISGPAKEKLQQYRISRDSNDGGEKYRIMN